MFPREHIVNENIVNENIVKKNIVKKNIAKNLANEFVRGFVITNLQQDRGQRVRRA